MNMTHCLIRVPLFLLLGAITTIAVAWGIVTWYGNTPPLINIVSDVFNATGFYKVRKLLTGSEFPENSYISIVLEKQTDGLSVTSVEPQRFGTSETWVNKWNKMPKPHLVAAKLIEAGIEQRIIFIGEFGAPKSLGQSFSGNCGLAQRVVGWPLKSLFYNPANSKRKSSNQRGKEKKVWRLPNVFGKLIPTTDELILPYGVLWPGFAINSIFYAAIFWLLTLGPFTTRRMMRRKRGLCIKCGYDLRGTEHEVCPECGTA